MGGKYTILSRGSMMLETISKRVLYCKFTDKFFLMFLGGPPPPTAPPCIIVCIYIYIFCSNKNTYKEYFLQLSYFADHTCAYHVIYEQLRVIVKFEFQFIKLQKLSCMTIVTG